MDAGNNIVSTALVPVREQTVEFYGDQVLAAQMADGMVLVPVRPICEALGLNWAGQQQRVQRDPVLTRGVTVCVIHTVQGPRSMLCLPLKLLPGWLFGINASRVKEELQDKILRYQTDCYEVLWNAFKDDILPSAPPTTGMSPAEQAVETARALLHLAEQQLEFERRLSTIADYMRPFVKDTRQQLAGHDQRITSLELQLSAGATISEAEASEVQLAIKNVAALLQSQGALNGHQRVYGELYRRYRIGAYRNLPAHHYQQVLDWLHSWYDELAGETKSQESNE